MWQVAGYLVRYSDACAIIDELKIPDGGADNIISMADPRGRSVTTSFARPVYSGCKGAGGVFPIIHIRSIRPQTVEAPVERERDKYVRK